MAITGLVLVVPLLVLARRGRLPVGAATATFVAAAALSGAVTGLHNVPLVLGLVASGVAVDVLAWWLRPAPGDPVRYRMFGALVPLLVWTVYLVVAYAVAGSVRILAPPGGHPERSVELYTGAPLVQALLGLLAAVLLAPRPTPVPDTGAEAPARDQVTLADAA
jgi:hypothetical protein